MKKLFAINVFLVLLVGAFALSAFGQTNAQIEQELVGHIKNIEKWSSYGEESNDELLSKENKIFEEKLLKYTKIAATLSYKFAALDEFMHIATSVDGRLRVFSWDTQDGGTMHRFSRVYQYRDAGGKVNSKSDDLDEEDAGSYVDDIFTVETKGGKVYLVCSTAIISTSQRYQSVSLYQIAGARLDDEVKMIKTRSGLTSYVAFEYDFFSIAESKGRPASLVSFDQKTNVLRIPVVINDKEFPNGRVTAKRIGYKFDGTYFVRTN